MQHPLSLDSRNTLTLCAPQSFVAFDLVRFPDQTKASSVPSIPCLQELDQIRLSQICVVAFRHGFLSCRPLLAVLIARRSELQNCGSPLGRQTKRGIAPKRRNVFMRWTGRWYKSTLTIASSVSIDAIEPF